MDFNEQLTLAALQLAPGLTLTSTFSEIRSLIAPLSSTTPAPDCIILPEYAFGTFREWLEGNWDSHEQFIQIKDEIANLCKIYKVAIIAGSIPYKEADETWRNRSYLFSATGKIIGYYDKQHPFRTEKHLGLMAGTQTPIHTLDQIRLVILICSDLWYPNIIEEISSQADFIAVPTMTTVLDQNHIAYGRWAWHSLVVVRAKENTIPIVSADQTAREYAQGIFTCGASCIADPSHRFSDSEGPHVQTLKIVTAQASTAITSTISLDAIKTYRAYREEVGLKRESKLK